MTIRRQGLPRRRRAGGGAAGIKVVFAVYRTRRATIRPARPTRRRSPPGWRRSRDTYPAVKTFIVGNEPNQPRSGGRSSAQRRARRRRRVRAGARRGVRRAQGGRPAIKVLGVGLSPRGNDRARTRPSNVSTSPVRFLARARRLVPRERPHDAADGRLSFHPYPNANTDVARRAATPGRTPAWQNADRIKQAIQDAFNGTRQPTTVRA